MKLTSLSSSLLPLFFFTACIAAAQDKRVELSPPAVSHLIYENDRGKIGFGKEDFIAEYSSFKQDYFGKLDAATIDRYEKAIRYFKKSKHPIHLWDSVVTPVELLSIKELLKNRVGVVLLNQGKAAVWENYSQKQLTWITSSREPSLPEGDHYVYETANVVGIFIGSAYGIHTPEGDEVKNKYKVFTRVETAASPLGGMTAYYQYLAEHRIYPEQAKKEGIEGKVLVEFVVLTDGTLEGFKVVKGLGGGCDEEAMRLIRDGPKWSPGTQDRVKVKQRFVLPVAFP